jgi:hypothetical protein
MVRRNNTILDLVFRLPWWMSVLIALFAYGGLKYVIPSLRTENIFLSRLGEIGPTFAPLVALLFLLPAPFSLYRDKEKQKQEDGPPDI